MKKTQWINIALLFSFLICYLEWAGGNSGFMFQLEYQIFFKSGNKESFMHPMVLLPLSGQLILLFAVFKPNRLLTIIGIGLLGVLVLMILLIGFLILSPKILLLALPFTVLSILFIINRKKWS